MARYNVDPNLTSGRIIGPERLHCKICALALQDEVDAYAKRGKTAKEIKQRLAYKFPEQYKVGKIKRLDINNHVGHGVGFTHYKIMKKAKKMMDREKKSIAQVQAMVLDNIGRSLEAASRLTDGEINTLTVKEKLKYAIESTKLLQTEKKIALDAHKQKFQEDAFISELNELSALGSKSED